MMAFYPEHRKWDQNPKFTPLSEATSIPTPFICVAPAPPPREWTTNVDANVDANVDVNVDATSHDILSNQKLSLPFKSGQPPTILNIFLTALRNSLLRME